MYYIYNLLLIFTVLICSPIIIVALITTPKFRAGFFQKMGFYPDLKKDGKKTIVVHAVSVGEVIAVEKFLKFLREKFPSEKIILTTVTKTGNNVAQQKLSTTVDSILYFPFDIVLSVLMFIKKVKPDFVIIAETEIWPCFARALKNNNIPVVIINGRISPHSHKGYKKFSWFFKHVLSNYAQILMQTSGDMERIIDIGAPKNITKVMGNLKFDIANTMTDENVADLKNEFKLGDNPMLLVGSTHKGEDEIALKAYGALIDKVPNLKMIIAPRHPERLKDVENLISDSGYSYGKRSNKDDFGNNKILLLDTMGELSKLYSISTVAFIGGSFSGTGGHNPLEAAIFNVPVVSGPSVFNFKDIYKYLIEDKAAFVVNNQEELENILLKLYTNNDFYAFSANACNQVFENNSGAIEKALGIIEKFL